MIVSFRDNKTRGLFNDEVVKDFQGIAARAKRKLEAVNAAARLDDLTVPPFNRLKKLRGAFREFYSIRVNDQWRIIFKWIDNNAHNVGLVNYH